MFQFSYIGLHFYKLFRFRGFVFKTADNENNANFDAVSSKNATTLTRCNFFKFTFIQTFDQNFVFFAERRHVDRQCDA